MLAAIVPTVRVLQLTLGLQGMHQDPDNKSYGRVGLLVPDCSHTRYAEAYHLTSTTVVTDMQSQHCMLPIAAPTGFCLQKTHRVLLLLLLMLLMQRTRLVCIQAALPCTTPREWSAASSCVALVTDAII
jgi:hypothetical protein